MNIIDVNYTWNGELTARKETKNIILHHAKARTASVEDIHKWHLENGWVGFGYHFLVRKDGNIYRGRPIWALGAHTEGWNDTSLGICFEGDFDQEKPTPAQEAAGIWLIRQLRKEFKGANVLRHKDCTSTDCPGANFPNTIIFEGMKDDAPVEHWAEKPYQELINAGIKINERRFDDKISRGETMSLLSQIVQLIDKK